MSKITLEISKNSIQLYLKKGQLHEHSTSDISQIMMIYVGHDIYANDSICYLFVFEHEFWVLPETLNGLYDTQKILLAEYNLNYLEASLDYLPWNWRAYRYCFGMEARTAVRHVQELDKIEEKLHFLTK
ncbi:MAG TPA: hypothetical protein DHW71_01440 [Gammaproteobacteria bacterium]|nr:hypothetical protein [Gammaproteobacteria bacterium]MEC8010876.1 hypothetical protein [Pseudomonadota bacterium]HCK91615.1 hypothetical protein [Gammaproteobacteria bacterium]|tara:strand:- start:1189 stop:1575 length:387 start_codon:yes stop_codon:yes gene_type:complete